MPEDNGNAEVKTVGSNGHNPEIDEAKLKSWLNDGDFDGAFQGNQIPSVIEKFVERGEKIEDLLLRAEFRDDKHVNKTVLLMTDSIHFKYAEFQESIINAIAARPSIKGNRMLMVLKAVIGKFSVDEEKKTSKWRNMMIGNKEDKQ